MKMALARTGLSLRRTGVLANSGTAEDQSGAMPTIVATAIRLYPTNAKTVLVLLILRTNMPGDVILHLAVYARAILCTG